MPRRLPSSQGGHCEQMNNYSTAGGDKGQHKPSQFLLPHRVGIRFHVFVIAIYVLPDVAVSVFSEELPDLRADVIARS